MKYDIVVEDSAESPTVRLQLFIMLSEMIRNGVPVPLAEVIKLSTIPADIKENMLSSIAESQKQQDEMDRLPYETEIMKTQINAQSKTGGIGATIPQAGGMQWVVFGKKNLQNYYRNMI